MPPKAAKKFYSETAQAKKKHAQLAAADIDPSVDRYSVDVIADGKCKVCQCIVPDAQKQLHLSGKKHAKNVFYNPVKKATAATTTATAAPAPSGGEEQQQQETKEETVAEKIVSTEGEGMLAAPAPGNKAGKESKFSAAVECPQGLAAHVIGLKGAGLIAIQDQVGYNCAIKRNLAQGPSRKKQEGQNDCTFFVQASRQAAADHAASLLAEKIAVAQEQVDSGRLKGAKKEEKKENVAKQDPEPKVSEDGKLLEVGKKGNENKNEQDQKEKKAPKKLAGTKRDRKEDSGESEESRKAKRQRLEETRRLEATEQSGGVVVNGVCTLCKCKVYAQNLALHLGGKSHQKKVKQAEDRKQFEANRDAKKKAESTTSITANNEPTNNDG